MRNNTLKHTKRTATSALLAALSFAVLYFGAISGIFDLCAVVVGALCVVYARIEMGGIYPWMICAVTFTLSLLLLTDKLVAFEYLFLGGFYPILKSFAERKGRKRGRVVKWAIKLGYFNAALLVFLTLAKFVFVSEDFIITGTTPGVAVAIFFIANAFYIFYDYAMTKFITYYLKVLRKKLKIGHSH